LVSACISAAHNTMPPVAFVLDMAGSEGRNPIEDLQHLRREIALYDPQWPSGSGG
jgi:hypothetical protein